MHSVVYTSAKFSTTYSRLSEYFTLSDSYWCLSLSVNTNITTTKNRCGSRIDIVNMKFGVLWIQWQKSGLTKTIVTSVRFLFITTHDNDRASYFRLDCTLDTFNVYLLNLHGILIHTIMRSYWSLNLNTINKSLVLRTPYFTNLSGFLWTDLQLTMIWPRNSDITLPV